MPGSSHVMWSESCWERTGKRFYSPLLAFSLKNFLTKLASETAHESQNLWAFKSEQSRISIGCIWALERWTFYSDTSYPPVLVLDTALASSSLHWVILDLRTSLHPQLNHVMMWSTLHLATKTCYIPNLSPFPLFPLLPLEASVQIPCILPDCCFCLVKNSLESSYCLLESTLGVSVYIHVLCLCDSCVAWLSVLYKSFFF